MERRPNTEIKYDISIYPNPAKDQLNIEITDYEDCQAEISIRDLSGRIVLSKRISQAKN